MQGSRAVRLAAAPLALIAAVAVVSVLLLGGGGSAQKCANGSTKAAGAPKRCREGTTTAAATAGSGAESAANAGAGNASGPGGAGQKATGAKSDTGAGSSVAGVSGGSTAAANAESHGNGGTASAGATAAGAANSATAGRGTATAPATGTAGSAVAGPAGATATGAGAYLASGRTETGAWAVTSAPHPKVEPAITAATITFTTPLRRPLREEFVIYVSEAEARKPGNRRSAAIRSACGEGGTAAAPTANPGHLCVYAASEDFRDRDNSGGIPTHNANGVMVPFIDAEFVAIMNRFQSPGANKTGATIAFGVTDIPTSEEEALGAYAHIAASGSWAVTGA